MGFFTVSDERVSCIPRATAGNQSAVVVPTEANQRVIS
jgi:hypothetical protein